MAMRCRRVGEFVQPGEIIVWIRGAGTAFGRERLLILQFTRPRVLLSQAGQPIG